ncbi:MAG: 3-hydroxyacyl-ACP dehydratase FabZ family protein [Planctomycetaceae bacterium]
MRFSLIDRITSLEPGRSITAIKTLSLAEEYLADHFPGFPVMPGVLMLESMVQAGAWLMRATGEFRHSTILLKQAKAVRFNNFVLPGQTLTVELTVLKQAEDQWTFKGTGTVQGAGAVNARLVLDQFNLADHNPDMAKSDQLRTETMRELFTQLWKN